MPSFDPLPKYWWLQLLVLGAVVAAMAGVVLYSLFYFKD